MGLTQKQESFAQLIVQGFNQSDAYRQSYDVSLDCSPATIWNDAYVVASNHDVAMRIQELRSLATAQVVESLAWTQERFLREAETNVNLARDYKQVSASNGALDMIGRVTGILTEKPTQAPVSITRVTVVLDSGTDRSNVPRIVEPEVSDTE